MHGVNGTDVLADLRAMIGTLTIDEAADLAGRLETLRLRCVARISAPRNNCSTEALDIEAVMARTGMSKGYLYREARRGRLPFVRRIGRRVIFDSAGLDRWLARRPH